MRVAQEAFIRSLIALEADPPKGLFETPPRGSVEDRWHVYGHGYLARIEEALSADYRAVRRVLGEGAFQSLVFRYLRATPPQSYDLARAGERLAGFLETDRLTQELPFLPDLARLEWRVVGAFVARDAPVLSRADLLRVGVGIAAEIRFTRQPSASLLRSAWPLAEIWALWDRPDDEVSVDLEARPYVVLVYRRGFSVFCESIDEDAAALVEAAASGTTLVETSGLCGASDEVSIQRLVTSFTRLVDRGIFTKKEEDK